MAKNFLLGGGFIQNQNISSLKQQITNYKRRLSQLENDKETILDNVTQANISYEIRFCKAEIEKLLKEINENN